MTAANPNFSNEDRRAERSQSNAIDDEVVITKPSFPTKLSDLTLQSSLDPEASINIYKVLSTLRKSSLSIPNRLLSILQDADFIEALFKHLNEHDSNKHSYGPVKLQNSHVAPQDIVTSATSRLARWPVIPNERSGSWPLPPQLKLDSQKVYLSNPSGETEIQPVSAYFKSTDGHVNQWSFSTRRLNLPVLNLLGSAGCAILVDTTRRGKEYPDALRRTVPMFTSVWNRLLFGEFDESGVCDFQAFGLEESEISQIEKRIPGFVRDLEGLGLNLNDLKCKLRRPIRCLWVSQPSERGQWNNTFDKLVEQIETERIKWEGIGGANILLCCSASRRVVGAEMSDEGYIQGAGDDSEGWSQGLTAKVFWDNYEEMMALVKTGSDLDNLVRELVQREKNSRGASHGILVMPTTNVFLSARKTGNEIFDLIVDCNALQANDTAKSLNLGCKEGKLGSKMLRDQLSRVSETIKKLFSQKEDSNILVACSTGKDLSVGVALTILCSFYNDDGSVQLGQTRRIDKQFIKQRLAWITTSKPDANPSRATLQAVNSFLIDRPE